MTLLRKCFVWFYMLTKRLLRQWSFLFLLCMIPASVLLANLAMEQDSGVLRIVLCSEDEDAVSAKIIDSLLNDDSIILFTQCSSAKQANELVATNVADAAWIFKEDFSKNLDRFVHAPASSDPIIQIVQRERAISLKFAREKLFGALAGAFSRSIYKDFSYSYLVDEQTVPPELVDGYYDKIENLHPIIRVTKLNSSPSAPAPTTDYLSTPLRGILSLMVVLCTLTATMCFLREQANGKFSWLPVNKRIIPAFASCLSASLLSGIAVFVALFWTGISIQPVYELCCMIVFILCVAGFSTVFCVVFQSAGKVGALMPGVLIVTFALSPIFFNIKVLKPIRMLLPTNYYLRAIYDTRYLLYSVVYCLAVYALTFALNILLRNRNKSTSSF